MTKDKTPDMETLMLELLETAAQIERRLDAALSGIRGISFSEYRLLRSLHESPSRSATRVDLARAVGLTPSAVTRALKPLEKLGYVNTRKADRDARRSLAILTAPGVELVADGRQVVRDILTSLPAASFGAAEAARFTSHLAEFRSKP